MSLKQPDPDKKFPETAFLKKSHTCREIGKWGFCSKINMGREGGSKDLTEGSKTQQHLQFHSEVLSSITGCLVLGSYIYKAHGSSTQ